MNKVPCGWATVALGELCDETEQRVPIATEVFRYIDIGSIDRERKVILEPTEMMGAEAPSRARKVVREGDVLVSMTRPNLNAVAVVPRALDGQIASTGFDVLRPTRIESRWVYYAVRTTRFVDAMTERVQGALYPAVRAKDVRAFAVAVAPLAEQKRIADKLDALLARVDACRDRLDRVPAILKRFRQAVLEKALSGDLITWPSDASNERVEWVPKTLADIASVGTGSTPLRSTENFYATTGTPWITSAATSSPFVHVASEHVTTEAVAAHRLKIYAPGTLLVAMYGEGKTRGQVSELRIAATINQALAAVTVDQEQALVPFVKLALLSQYDHMRALAEGGNQPNLNLAKVRSIPILLPPKSEQAEIVRRVEALFALADTLEARLATARAQVERLTPALLSKAFRGELVPQDPNDEPASVLLARIRVAAEGAPAQAAAKGTLRKRAAARA